MKRALLCGCLALAAYATPAAAQDAACPSGNYSVVRTSKIKPGGTLDGFKHAVADHAKWYIDHGYTADKFQWARVVTYDPAAKKMVASPDTVMTFHNNATEVPSAKRDAAWDAYVAEYAANSTIVTTTVVCVAN